MPSPAIDVGEDGVVTIRKLQMNFEAPIHDVEYYGEDYEDIGPRLPFPEYIPMDELSHQLASKLEFK